MATAAVANAVSSPGFIKTISLYVSTIKLFITKQRELWLSLVNNLRSNKRVKNV